ncbi:hypothetical protein ACVMHY_010491 [Bradyrhizobium barranii subsp. barranii]
MARRTAIVACLFLAYSTSNALADCGCLKIGIGICVPDPTCAAAVRHSIDKVGIDAGKAVEKAATDTGKALEKAGHPLPNTPASIDIITKATQDASHAINKSVQDVRDTARPFRRLRILETGYSQLPELGREEAGYGLYSYAVLSSTDTNRSTAFLAEVFKSIPAIEQTGANQKQLNIFYVPIKKDKTNDFADAIESSGDDVKKLGATYATSLYDYKVGRTILDHICNPPDDSMQTFCAGDTSRGPYIFTYERPATAWSICSARACSRSAAATRTPTTSIICGPIRHSSWPAVAYRHGPGFVFPADAVAAGECSAPARRDPADLHFGRRMDG